MPSHTVLNIRVIKDTRLLKARPDSIDCFNPDQFWNVIHKGGLHSFNYIKTSDHMLETTVVGMNQLCKNSQFLPNRSCFSAAALSH